MNVEQYFARLANLPTPSPTVMPPAADPWNSQQPPSSLPYIDRFAGGRMRSSYTPYTGDPTQYGYGGQHRFFTPDTTNWTGTNTSTATTTATNSVDPTSGGGPDGGSQGGDRDAGRDNGSWESVSQWANDPGVRRDFNALVEMASPIVGGFNAAFGDPLGREAGKNAAAGVVAGNAALSGDPMMAAAEAETNAALGAEAEAVGQAQAAAAEANIESGVGASPYAKGGIVKGDKKLGKDDVLIKADGGEGVVKAVIVKDLGEDFIKRLNAGKYDRRLLLRAVHA